MWSSIGIAFLIVTTSLFGESFVIVTSQTVSERIIGGSPAAIGEFPHVVAIRVDKKFRCGGFIYNERWVVTTASCVQGFNNLLDRVTVEAGVTSLDSPEPSQQLYRIESFHVYDSYDESLMGPLHDLALIQTNSPFTFNSNVNFSYYDEMSTKPENITFVGWGSTAANSGLYSNELYKAKLTVFSSTQCKISYENYNNAYMICTGNASVVGTGSPCYYDEGSPLMENGLVIGVMSRNQGCDATGTTEPTLYTRLSPYYTWMSTTAGSQPVLSNPLLSF